MELVSYMTPVELYEVSLNVRLLTVIFAVLYEIEDPRKDATVLKGVDQSVLVPVPPPPPPEWLLA